MTVTDASAVVEFLLRTPRGRRFEELLEFSDPEIHAPALVDVEVASALRGLALADRLSEERLVEALSDYEALPILRHGHVGLLPRMLELRHNFSAYDAAYVALAEELGAELHSADEALRRAVSAHTDLKLV
jgi:predicted nucleic acid-binding protein